MVSVRSLNPTFVPKGAATTILLGGSASSAGVGESSVVLFWRAKALCAWSAVDAAVEHATWAKGMYLKALSNALVPETGHSSKCVKAIKCHC